jgi:hypothetical protein
MDEPSREPGSSPPTGRLGRSFWITLFGPIALLLAAWAIGARLESSVVAGFLGYIAILSAPVSLIACTTMVGIRVGAVAALLTFVGVAMFYLAIVFAGCMAMFRGL